MYIYIYMIFYPMCQCYYCRQQNFVLCFFSQIILYLPRFCYNITELYTNIWLLKLIIFKHHQFYHGIAKIHKSYMIWLVPHLYIFLFMISIQWLSDAHTDRGTDAGNNNTLSALWLRLKTHPKSDILNLQRSNPRYLSITPFLYQNGCINSSLL